jgi:hypothetical protein
MIVDMIDKSNHGQVGVALYIKFTAMKFLSITSKARAEDVYDGQVFYPEDKILIEYGISSSVPIYIDNNTQGDYEVVCDHGVEVHEYNEVV